MYFGNHIISQNDAFLASWICASLAFAILLIRLVAHRHQRRGFDTIAYVVAGSIVTLAARTICNALILHWGTINTPGLEDASKTRTSSILVLCARVLVTTYYWLQSILLLLFYREMMNHVSWIHKAIRLCWVIVGLTYFAVILATFLECRSVTYYWTRTPEGLPHQCTRAYAQILLQCVSNLVIDLILLVVSAPILKAQIRQWPANLQLGLLYLLGTFCIIVIGLKIHFIFRDGSVQHARSFWASVQVVVSTFVANAPSIYGAVKIVKRRRSSVMSLARLRTGESDYFNVSGPPPKPPVLKFPEWQDDTLSRPALARFGKP
ncbi:hypothetical protein Slin15195_G003240 [Septoria linicola]|uniref:Rhodopsin domain-containing protein n=1 Tax=Septoria linicola TaxID=215465 RepID=A0A9Q9AIE8_9PEZI|nr:hypothetical protein Slin14017_G003270 [Septoria linicola]USW47005.1 hypothetical protein Slin15195_G003240 [Septoria linicola]